MFADEDQARLQEVVIELARRGVHVVLSNSTAPSVTALYESNPAAAAAGLHTWRVPARRSVNSNAEKRGAVEEIVVSNVRPRPVTA
jgi:DNA adenine methylase